MNSSSGITTCFVSDAMRPNRHRSGLDLAVSDHQQVWESSAFPRPGPGNSTYPTARRAPPRSLLARSFRTTDALPSACPSVIGSTRDLHRCEPHRKCSGEVLDQEAREPLQGAEDRPVNHYRPMRLVVLTDVLELETFRQVEIELNRRALPFPPIASLNLMSIFGP